MPAPDPTLAPGLGVGLLGLVILTGPALPLSWGLLPVVAALVLAIGLGRWRAAGMSAAAIGGLAAWRRGVLAALVVLPAIIVVASAVRMIAGVCVAVPPASAALLVLALLGPLALRGRFVNAGAAVVGGLAIAAAIGASRIEASAPGGRGFAHTGPILGIHPFQTTAIVIDGYGPFDLPINDYVEPDGSRGYGPEALAEALQRDLAQIAEQQFADGPARAYQAFAGARVEAVVLPAQQERLDRPVEAPTEPRLVVWSGTTGWRSRVEFVCPGQRNDPRPRPADTVLDRMCPDKYSSEASAGLGVTGRWTGYTEGRGVAWPDLARVFGGSRNDAERATLVLRWELRGWGWIALLLVLPGLVWPTAGRAVARGGAVIGGAALAVLAVMVVWTWPQVQVPAIASASPWTSPWAIGVWAPALVVALAASLGGRAATTPAIGPTALVGLVSWARAGALAAGSGLRPTLTGIAGEGLSEGIAGALVEVGLVGELGVAEAIAASVVVMVLLGLVAGVVGLMVGRVGALLGPTRPVATGRWLGLAVIVAAGSLVLSRKTIGGAALLGPALALALVAVTGVALVTARGRGRGRWPRIVDHGLAVLLVLVAAAEVWAGHHNLYTATLLGVGVIAALLSLGLVAGLGAGPAAVRSGPVSPEKATQG